MNTKNVIDGVTVRQWLISEEQALRPGRGARNLVKKPKVKKGKAK